MRIIVDRSACIGAASCVALAMKTFQLDMEGKAEVIHVTDKQQTTDESSGVSTIDNDAREAIIDAARSCPTNAITVIDDDGTPIV
ncbi:MAG: ferredoxin [Candidatus Uhrbacteria bacterium]|nr:ferredoxin [Candidatus Uhrbacteria bacterium]MDP3793841.1 ferredoxin [Candidatus Uhrbacteria bacterium]